MSTAALNGNVVCLFWGGFLQRGSTKEKEAHDKISEFLLPIASEMPEKEVLQRKSS